MVNSPLINKALFLGVWHWGVPLDSHEKTSFTEDVNQDKHIGVKEFDLLLKNLEFRETLQLFGHSASMPKTSLTPLGCDVFFLKAGKPGLADDFLSLVENPGEFLRASNQVPQGCQL